MTKHDRPAARARVAAAAAAREVADAARDMVGTASDDMPAAERIQAARHLRLLALGALDLAVIAEVLDGLPVEEAAEALGLSPATVASRYGDAVNLWARPEESEQRGPGEAGDPDVAGTAAGLDQWWARHQDGDPRGSGGLEPVRRLLDLP